MFDGIAENAGRKTELPIAIMFYEIAFLFYYLFIIYFYLTVW